MKAPSWSTAAPTSRAEPLRRFWCRGGAESDGALLERVDCRSLQHGAVDVEARAVARAIPRCLGRVEAQQAAEVGAAQGDGVDAALLVAVDAGLAEAVADHAGLAGGDVVRGARLGGLEAVDDEIGGEL